MYRMILTVAVLAGMLAPARGQSNIGGGTGGSGTSGGGGVPSGVIDASSSTYGYKTVDGIHGGYAVFDATFSNTLSTISTGSGDPTFCNAGSVPCTGGQLTSVGMAAFGTTGGVAQAKPASQLLVPQGTIVSVQSAHAATVSTVSSATCAATCVFVWGPINTASQTAAWTAAAGAVAGPCNSFHIPASLTLIDSNFGSTAATCRLSQSGPAESEMTVYGDGYFSSLYVLVPAFPLTAANCNGTAGACLFGENGVNYREFGVWGGENNNTSSSGTISIMTNPTDSHWQRVSITGIGANDANNNFTGFTSDTNAGGTNVFDVTVDGAGRLPCLVNGALHIVFYDVFCADSVGVTVAGLSVTGAQLRVTGTTQTNFSSYGSVFEGGNTSNTGVVLVDGSGTTYNSYGDGCVFQTNAAGNCFEVATGATAYIDGANFYNSTHTGDSGIYVHGGTLNEINTQNFGGSAGSCIFIDSSGKYFNQAGNKWLTCGTKVNVSAGSATAAVYETGTVTCTTSAATITYKWPTYFANPIIVIQDQTTAGVVTQTSISTTTKVVGCPGASDVLFYSVAPNPA